jgi:hypothetical protein
MPYVLVFLLAAAAGGAVALLTLRNGRVATATPGTWTTTYREDPPEHAAETPTKGRPLPSAPTAQTRMMGAAGLLGAVLVGAGAVAFLAYLVWHALSSLISFPQA